MKRGGVGACFRICQQSWDLYADGRRVDARHLPGRQISEIAQVRAYADAGVHVLKLQGRSLSPERLAPLVRSYREAIDSPDRPAERFAPRPLLPDTWTVVGR
jgi:collagenase-like PrtC family protease